MIYCVIVDWAFTRLNEETKMCCLFKRVIFIMPEGSSYLIWLRIVTLFKFINTDHCNILIIFVQGLVLLIFGSAEEEDWDKTKRDEEKFKLKTSEKLLNEQ